VAEDSYSFRIAALLRLFYWHLLKESINEFRGLSLGHLVPETGPYIKKWATEQGMARTRDVGYPRFGPIPTLLRFESGNGLW
jgi:hypothetical protein